jgi:hypothetical protein
MNAAMSEKVTRGRMRADLVARKILLEKEASELRLAIQKTLALGQSTTNLQIKLFEKRTAIAQVAHEISEFDQSNHWNSSIPFRVAFVRMARKVLPRSLYLEISQAAVEYIEDQKSAKKE